MSFAAKEHKQERVFGIDAVQKRAKRTIFTKDTKPIWVKMSATEEAAMVSIHLGVIYASYG